MRLSCKWQRCIIHTESYSPSIDTQTNVCSFCVPRSRILFRLVFSSPHKMPKLKYDNIASQFSVTFSSTYQPQKGFGSLRQLIATPPQLAVILLQNNCGNTLAGTHSHLMPKGKQSLPPMPKPPSEATQRGCVYKKLIFPQYITDSMSDNLMGQFSKAVMRVSEGHYVYSKLISPQ